MFEQIRLDTQNTFDNLIQIDMSNNRYINSLWSVFSSDHHQDCDLPCPQPYRVCPPCPDGWIGTGGLELSCEDECWCKNPIATTTELGLFIVGDGLQIELNYYPANTGLMWTEVDSDVFNEATNRINDELMNQQDDKQSQLNYLKEKVLGSNLLINRFPTPPYQ